MGFPTEPPNSHPASDDPIYSGRFDVGDKTYFVDLKRNPRGTYLKIKERHQRGNATILVPSEGFEAFIAELNRALDAAKY